MTDKTPALPEPVAREYPESLVEQLHDRLREALDRADRAEAGLSAYKTMLQQAEGDINRLLDRATTAEAALDSAWKVIEPFAKLAGKLDGIWKDHEVNWLPTYGNTTITVGDLRAANQWLSANQKPQPPKGHDSE